MPKKPKISDTELSDFYASVKDIKRHVHEKVSLAPPTPKYAPKRNAEPAREETFRFSETDHLDAVEGRAFIAHYQSGISQRTFKKLKKGQFPVEAVLDLHGKTVAEARLELNDFLRACLAEQLRVVLIIHGKGQHTSLPILKNKINHWLRELNVVLAFCSAISAHGGGGATYVYLKHITEEDVT